MTWRKLANKQLLLVLVVALAMRLIYFLCYRDSPLFDIYLADQIYYRDWALRLIAGSGGGEVFEQGPLYAYWLAGIFSLTGNAPTLPLLLQLLCGSLTVLLVGWLGGRLFDQRAGLIAGLLAAVYGPLVFYDCMLMKSFLEPLLVLLVVAAFLQGVSSRRVLWFGFSGLLVGLACLVREAHILLLGPLLWFSVCGYVNGRSWRPAVLLLIGCALVLTPSTLRNWWVGGEFVPVTAGGGEVLYMGFGPAADGYCTQPYFVRPYPFDEHQDFRREAAFRSRTPVSRKDASDYWSRAALQEIARFPGRSAKLLMTKTRILLQDAEVPDSEDYDVTGTMIPLLHLLPSFGWITGLALLGLVCLWRRSGQGRLVGLTVLVLVAEVLLTYNYGRFRLALAALCLVAAGVGGAWLLEKFQEWRCVCWQLAGALLLVIGAAWLAWSTPPRVAMSSDYRTIVQTAAEKRNMIPVLEQERAQRPDASDPLYYLGEALWISGKTQEAVAVYELLVEEHPEDLDGHRALGNIYRSFGQLEKAAGHAEALIRLLPEDYYGYFLAGQIALDQGMLRQPRTKGMDSTAIAAARKWLLRASLLQPTDAEVHHLLGRFLYFTGNTSGALEELNRALELNPGLAQARFDLEFLHGQ